jgi:hypothetical protein
VSEVTVYVNEGSDLQTEAEVSDHSNYEKQQAEPSLRSASHPIETCARGGLRL